MQLPQGPETRMKGRSVYLHYMLKVVEKLVCTLYMCLKEKKARRKEKKDDDQSFVR